MYDTEYYGQDFFEEHCFQETTARIQVYIFLTEIELQILKVVTRISCEIQDNGQSVLKCTDEVSSRLLVSEFTNFR